MYFVVGVELVLVFVCCCLRMVSGGVVGYLIENDFEVLGVCFDD